MYRTASRRRILSAFFKYGVLASWLCLLVPSALSSEKDQLKAKLEELEAKLGKTPENSSLPPSSQHPHAKPQRPKKKTQRKRGGQRGHKKHQRTLIPTEECKEVIPLKPGECRRCGASRRASAARLRANAPR